MGQVDRLYACNRSCSLALSGQETLSLRHPLRLNDRIRSRNLSGGALRAHELPRATLPLGVLGKSCRPTAQNLAMASNPLLLASNDHSICPLLLTFYRSGYIIPIDIR